MLLVVATVPGKPEEREEPSALLAGAPSILVHDVASTTRAM